jgi:hypothetical protein
MNKARQTKEKKLEDLKKQLTKFDLAVPGTIRTTYLKCGKPSCACWKDKNARHGPYYFWDRKVDGNLSSKSITKQMVPLLKKWIENRKGAEKLFFEILKLGQTIAADRVEIEKN